MLSLNIKVLKSFVLQTFLKHKSFSSEMSMNPESKSIIVANNEIQLLIVMNLSLIYIKPIH